MKKLIFATLLAIVGTSALAQTGKSIYQKYSSEKNVSSVYISPAMFKMMGKVPELEIADEDVNISSVIKSLEGMYILDCENVAVMGKIKADVTRMISSGKMELLMEANDDGEHCKIYVCAKDGVISSFVLLNEEKDELDFICFEGKMSQDDLQKILNSKNRKK